LKEEVITRIENILEREITEVRLFYRFKKQGYNKYHRNDILIIIFNTPVKNRYLLQVRLKYNTGKHQKNE
jgi:hypothetical protein